MKRRLVARIGEFVIMTVLGLAMFFGLLGTGLGLIRLGMPMAMSMILVPVLGMPVLMKVSAKAACWSMRHQRGA